MVDWSAASKPRLGKVSIWMALARHGGEPQIWNVPNRLQATERIADVLVRELDDSRRVLAGFDFPFGYPKGATEIMCAGGWKKLWERFAELIPEHTDNSNSRFDAAAKLNLAFGQADGPFWGNGLRRDIAGLPRLKPMGYGANLPPRLRLIESVAKGAQEVWKLSGAGSVGSQSLTGLAALFRLRNNPKLQGKTTVWPLESGFNLPQTPITFVEIYPSLLVPDPSEPIKDAGQVRAASVFFAELDRGGKLGGCFAAPAQPSPEERDAVASEEGWIFGVEKAHRITKNPGKTAAKRPLFYQKNPTEIYAKSFAIVRTEARLDRFPANMQDLVIRLIHACGMVEIADRLAFSANAVTAGQTALNLGKPILCDAEMVASGIIRRHLPANNPVIVTLNDPKLPSIGNTRSAAAVELWRESIEGAIVAIGNAPTALFHLLELLDEGWPKPALILGFPVGFVGAAESKAELARASRGCEFIALKGRKGGSALAAAAVNALAGGLN